MLISITETANLCRSTQQSARANRQLIIEAITLLHKREVIRYKVSRTLQHWGTTVKGEGVTVKQIGGSVEFAYMCIFFIRPWYVSVQGLYTRTPWATMQNHEKQSRNYLCSHKTTVVVIRNYNIRYCSKCHTRAEAMFLPASDPQQHTPVANQIQYLSYSDQILWQTHNVSLISPLKPCSQKVFFPECSFADDSILYPLWPTAGVISKSR